MGDDWGRQLGRWAIWAGAIGPFGGIVLFGRDPSDAFWLTLIACLPAPRVRMADLGACQ